MLKLTGSTLSIENVVEVARSGRRVALLDGEVCARLQAAQEWVDHAVNADSVIYGVTTGFGPLATCLLSALRPRASRVWVTRRSPGRMRNTGLCAKEKVLWK